MQVLHARISGAEVIHGDLDAMAVTFRNHPRDHAVVERETLGNLDLHRRLRQAGVARPHDNAIDQPFLGKLSRGNIDRDKWRRSARVQALNGLASLVQHIFADRNDERGLFRQCNELGR